MSRGFSLIELIVSIVLLQVGVLATVGLIFLAQEDFRRAELTLRGILEAHWVADSLSLSPGGGAQAVAKPWGTLVPSSVADPVPGIRVSSWSWVEEDTLAAALCFEPQGVVSPPWPDSVPEEERW